MSYAVSLGETPAFANRDDLMREVKEELNRADITDLELRSGIQLVEAYLNRNLRVSQMEVVTSIDLFAGVGDVPSDFLALRAMYDADRVAIPAVDAVAMIETETGQRKVCAIVGNDFRVSPREDETVTVIYWAKIPALTIDQQTNWVMDSFPDVYWFGVLAFVTSRIGDDASGNVEKWHAAFRQSAAELVEHGKRRRFGGPLLQRSVVRQVRGAAI